MYIIQYITHCRVMEQADVAGRALSKAESIGGSVRFVSRSDQGQVKVSTAVLRDVDNKSTASVEEIMESLTGFVQVYYSLLIHSTLLFADIFCCVTKCFCMLMSLVERISNFFRCISNYSLIHLFAV